MTSFISTSTLLWLSLSCLVWRRVQFQLLEGGEGGGGWLGLLPETFYLCLWAVCGMWANILLKLQSIKSFELDEHSPCLTREGSWQLVQLHWLEMSFSFGFRKLPWGEGAWYILYSISIKYCVWSQTVSSSVISTRTLMWLEWLSLWCLTVWYEGVSSSSGWREGGRVRFCFQKHSTYAKDIILLTFLFVSCMRYVSKHSAKVTVDQVLSN